METCFFLIVLLIFINLGINIFFKRVGHFFFLHRLSINKQPRRVSKGAFSIIIILLFPSDKAKIVLQKDFLEKALPKVLNYVNPGERVFVITHLVEISSLCEKTQKLISIAILEEVSPVSSIIMNQFIATFCWLIKLIVLTPIILVQFFTGKHFAIPNFPKLWKRKWYKLTWIKTEKINGQKVF